MIFLRRFLFPFFILLFISQAVFAQSFTIRKIEFRGLQRISRQTAMSYLPVHVGNRFNEPQGELIIKKLYDTGFFTNVQLFEGGGGTLVIKLQERPIISLIQVNGNKAIETKKLKPVLRKLGIVEGQPFYNAKLKMITVGLEHEYGELGYPNAVINARVRNLSRNRVALTIDINEGKVIKVHSIHIIGNHAFSERTLKNQFQLTTPGILTWINHKDRYSKTKLAQDLQHLSEFYANHGYIRFRITKQQVILTRNHKGVDIYITVSEGPQYHIGGFTIAGDTLGYREQMLKLIKLKKGEVFSRAKVIDTNRILGSFLANRGYAFANVAVGTRIDDSQRLIYLTFRVVHGVRVYVRHIYFTGNNTTEDVVLRREMRQMEAAPYSLSKINSSKRRLLLLPYIRNVNIKNEPVPGSSDEVDVNYDVKEVAAGKAQVSAGYSDAYGFLYGAGISQPNFMGTGKTLSLGFSNNQVQQYYSFSYFDPYFTIDGISQYFDIYYTHQKYDQDFNFAPYTLNAFGGDLSFGFPISEHQTMGLGAGYENVSVSNVQTDLSASEHAAPSVIDFMNNKSKNTYNLFKVTASWVMDYRDRAIFPNKGVYQNVNGELGVPVFDSSLGYYKINYSFNGYLPLFHGFILNFKTNVGYGDGYGDTKRLPFFLNYYAGGIDGGVPGFAPNSLGPKNSTYDNSALGGNLLMTGGVHLILPNFFTQKLRVALTLDGGNVFQSPVFGLDNPANGVVDNQSFSFSNMRVAAGILVSWYSPIGPINLSLAFPVVDGKFDDKRPFQFSFGTNIG